MVIKRKRKTKRRPQHKSWINSDVSINPKHHTLIKRNDVFKRSSKNLMSSMFKDSDRDGVANAFDCSPHNKKKQGLLDAIVAVAKGKGKAGWKEGMAKKKKKKPITTKKMTMAQYKAYARNQAILNKAKAGRKKEKMENVSKGVRAVTKKINVKGKADRVYLALKRANPKYNVAYEKKPKGMTLKQWREERHNYIIRRTARRQLIGGGASTKANTLTKTITGIFPQVQARTAKGGAVGVPGQRGRPRGSYKGKYAAYGGVFGYRKALALQKKAAKFAQQQAELQAKLQGQPQYETQQYQQPQEVPQETPGAVPDYKQFQQLQEQAQQGQEVIYEQAPQQAPQQYPQYQQPQQQYAQEPQQRPIGTVFKSSGGHPYPAVGQGTAQSSLAPSNSNPDYIEYADAFTGERKWKRKTKSEGWSRPKDPNQEPIVKQSWMGNR